VRWTARNLDVVAGALLAHIGLVGAALALALALGLPLGLLVARHAPARAAVLGAASVLYSIPTLALFALLVPVLGLGTAPALLALVTYAVPILLRALVAGIATVPAEVLEAADGMGLTPRQRLLRVELPLALPALLAGLRVAGVTLVSAATVGAYINAGGLGTLILTGLDQGHTEKILVGAGLTALLALGLDAALRAAQRRLPEAGGG
jgi:osmoprotectant transport system permease protein